MRRCLLLLFLLPGTLLLAQGKKPMPKDTPKVLVALPFGVEPGVATKVALRGLKIDQAKEVRVSPRGAGKILTKKKVPVPNQQDADRVGDSEVEVELTVPAHAAGEAVEVVVVTSAGESKPHAVLLDRSPPVAEKEPNDGFAQAQVVGIGQTVQGAIARPQDVDVYRFEGKAGQKVVIEVRAARLGSPLDSFLSLNDATGGVLSMNDDSAGSSDSRIQATLMKTGAYHVCVSDAHDQGGSTYAYRLTIRAK